MEKNIPLSDKRFYTVLAVAVIALLIGASGLIVSLSQANGAVPANSSVRPSEGSFSPDKLPQNGQTNTTPDGATNHIGPQQSGNANQQPAR